MALPMLIMIAALLLWTLIPEPDRDADPVENPASKPGGSPTSITRTRQQPSSRKAAGVQS